MYDLFFVFCAVVCVAVSVIAVPAVFVSPSVVYPLVVPSVS